jgi:streptomycin 6-kinase
MLRDLEARWSIAVGAPIDTEEVSAGWVAPARRRDGEPAFLKLAMPHFEGEHEIAGLRVWNGHPTVHLLEADESLGAMLLERCEPGSVLRGEPEESQDEVIAAMLLRLWRVPAPPHPFRSLAALMEHWSAETRTHQERWPDAGLVREGLRLFATLSAPAPDDVLLATDLHAGNVLRARREPWLVIDPKPFVGDRAYDATQHLFNGLERLAASPEATIARVADRVGVDRERVRLWTFARAAAEPRRGWTRCRRFALARAMAL